MRMFSPENVPMPAAMEEAEDEKMKKELMDFIVQGGYTGNQAHEAYLQFAGVSDKEPDQAVEEIRAKMQTLHEAGLSYSQLAKIVGQKEKLEDTLPEYHQFIDGLEIAENEKLILLSIVEKLRTGHIECRVGDQAVGEFEMAGQGVSKERQAMEMMNSIRYILKSIEPGKKYEFSFEEK